MSVNDITQNNMKSHVFVGRKTNDRRKYYMREFLKGLELDQEMIDTIMAEYGKLVTQDKEELQSLKGEILSLQETSKNAIELQDKYEALTKQIEQDNAEKKAKAENDMMMKNINEAPF